MPISRTPADHDSDIGNLYELLRTIVDLISHMPFVRDGERDIQLDQISALARIAEQMAERLNDEVEYGYPAPLALTARVAA